MVRAGMGRAVMPLLAVDVRDDPSIDVRPLQSPDPTPPGVPGLEAPTARCRPSPPASSRSRSAVATDLTSSQISA